MSTIGFRSSSAWKPAGGALLVAITVTAAFLNRALFFVADAGLLIYFAPSLLLNLRLMLARRRRR